MVGSTSRTVAPGDKHAMQAPSPPTSPLDRRTSRPWTSPVNETSGSFSKGTQHRRRLSSNQERGKPTANKSEAKPSRSQGESSAKRKEQNRIAQRAFRKRQKAHLEELEAEVIEKGSRIKEITENNGVLLETMKQLQSQNIEMKHSRVPTELGYQLPFLTATGTPLTSELGRDKNGEDRAGLDINRHGRGRDVRHGRTNSNSENSQSSSSETRDSTASSPEILSPVMLQGASVVRTPHMGSLTGLQLNLQPSAESTSYPTPISASHSFQSLRDGSFSHMGYTFAPPNNFPKQPDGQQWMSFGAVQPMPPTYQHGFTVSEQHLGPGQHFSPPGHQPSQHPGQSYQTLPPPPIRRNSEALTHHHVRSLGSLTDFNSMYGSMSARPHTSISTSRGPSKVGESRAVSMSVPTSTRHLPDGNTEEEMLLSRAFPTSPSQPVPAGSASTKRAAAQHLTYQRPNHAYSASASNIGLSFSPISPPNLLGGGDLQYDYASSSAPYFSNLSIQPPQSALAMEMGRSPPQDQYDHDHSGSSRDGWADMMPSMGATTPLQELNHENPLNTVGSEPLAIDQYRNHSLSSSEQAFSPDPSIFSLTGLDHAGGLEFPFAPMQMFSSPPETRQS